MYSVASVTAEMVGGAPPLTVKEWFNTDRPLTLNKLRGRVVLLHAFQMLCPGCVSHGVPLAERIHRVADPNRLVVIGLHTVFEHHDAMNPNALKAFLHEYRITHPVAVDLPDASSGIPATMRAYGMKGTPSTIIIDAKGRVRLHEFGRVDEFSLGVIIGGLLPEAGCDEGGCMLPDTP